MIKIFLTGALGSDCEVRETSNKKVINFKVGVSHKSKDTDGQRIEKTEWVKAVLWKENGQSTKVADYLKKGQKVYIEGVPSSEAFESKENGVKSSLVVNVKELEFIGSKS